MKFTLLRLFLECNLAGWLEQVATVGDESTIGVQNLKLDLASVCLLECT